MRFMYESMGWLLPIVAIVVIPVAVIWGLILVTQGQYILGAAAIVFAVLAVIGTKVLSRKLQRLEEQSTP